MKLTIVIVNYNVRFFLEQTLRSVLKSKTDFDYQVCVVDNASSDGSIEMMQEKFPDIELIALEENVGFSAGNNAALKQLKTPYALLLNPDTIISEHTLQVCMDKMESSPEVGGLGVRMIDGSGRFLPESKRGLPTPWVAFCKAFGLSKVFPRSPQFNEYHLGYIDEMDEAKVPVLSGAFMWLRTSVLEEIGLLDEAFFMYGEDIDLSYRIEQAGYKNWYLPTTSIVHFKGESTKRGSLNYVRVFYNAMIIFANKHFVGSGAWFMSFLYKAAVVLRALLGLLGQAFRRVFPMLVDGALILMGLRLMTWFWAEYYFRESDYFSSVPLAWHHGLYTGVWLLAMYLGGAYDQLFSQKKLRKSLIYGTVFLFLVFSLMPSSWRPSRAVLLLGSVWTWAGLSLWRYAWARLTGHGKADKRLGIVGSREEVNRALSLMQSSGFSYDECHWIAPNEEEEAGDFVGSVSDLNDIVEAYQLNEIIFCTKDVDHEVLIKWMTRFSDQLTVRIIPDEGTSMITSRYKHRKGELHTIDGAMKIVLPEYQRQKRFLDMVVGLVILMFSPVLVFLKNGRQALTALVSVLSGKKTWVSYDRAFSQKMRLPVLRSGVWDIGEEMEQADGREKLYYLYARDYSIWTDIEWIFRKVLEK